MNSETVTETGEALLREVITAICQYPKLVEIEFLKDESTVLVQIVAHPTDARILVGGGGAHIKALASLARLLFYGSQKIVTIMPIASHEDAEEKPYRKFQPNPKWPELKMMDLAETLTRNVFRNANVKIKSEEDSDCASKFIIQIEPPQNATAVRKFSAAMAILFQPIGCNVGRMIYCGVKK